MAIHWTSRATSRGANWWIAILFAIGSACFLAAPFPGFVQLVGSRADGVTFFVGSLFFTSAALLQALCSPQRDRLATLIQFAGTIFFNVDTFRAMRASVDTSQVDRLVWFPELIGSICFLASGLLAYAGMRRAGHATKQNEEWRIASVNLAGCILFMISALAGYVVPSTGDVLDLAAANWATALGALAFLIGALILMPRRGRSAATPQRGLAARDDVSTLNG